MSKFPFTPEQLKIQMVIEQSTDIEFLRQRAMEYLAMASWAQSAPNNYRSVYKANNYCFADGTKEYCIGAADNAKQECYVVCGDMVCWPDEFYGKKIEVKP